MHPGTKSAAVVACAIAATGSFGAAKRGLEAPMVSGRVSVAVVDQEATAGLLGVERALQARFASASGRTFPSRRLISVRPSAGEPLRFAATIYDYEIEGGFELLVDAQGRELSREPLAGQPSISPSEVADAIALVSGSPRWAEGVASGHYQVYPAMPPITVDAEGRRLINVDVIAPEAGSRVLLENEVVSVHLPTGTITRHPTGAPPSSSASLLACNPPPSSGCGASVGSCAFYQVQWPAGDPVWKFKVRHPSCTDAVQSDGTGLELTDVYYRGRLVLKRAEMPVLNVKYDGDACGPYRDWLDSEDCFQATGTDVAPGIRVTTGNPSPYTFCEADPPSDAGNFRGVAIHDQGDALWLITESTAGWYRYVMEWRLHLDGTIEPIVGFGAVANGCTCNLHHHHGYWRFEWALDAASDGTTDNPATGIATLERRRAGTQGTWDPIAAEGKFTRPTLDFTSDWFRVKNPQTGMSYVIQPGVEDGSADANGDGTPDSYAKGDLWGLALHAGQINDPNSDTSANIDSWINGEALGSGARLVTWYRAGYDHNGNVDPEPCELAGPRLVFSVGCQGVVNLDREAYGCGSAVAISVEDSDLIGTASLGVAVSSTIETQPETVTLAETPAGSGHFVGSITTTAGAPVAGDGLISVADGGTMSVRYLDASACGVPGVNVDGAADIDCRAPALSNVRAIGITGNGATIAWNTDEPGSSVVHFGTAPPGASQSSSSAPVVSHALAIGSLADCTTYYFWVASADAAGNLGASNEGGGYYTFRTLQTTLSTYAYTGPPVPIPDLYAPGAMASLSVPDSRTIQDANVTVGLTHTYDSDIELSLITPGNASIPLSFRHGGSGDNYTNTVFDDEAATAITAGSPPFTGSFRPDSPLAAVDGTSSSGTWSFKVVDQVAQDVGTINSWSLTLAAPTDTCPATPAPPPVPDGMAGSGMRAARQDAAGSRIDLDWNTSLCPAPNYHLVYGALADVAGYGIAGGVCGLGPAGSYTWTGVPAGDLWFLVVGDNGGSVEGTWGKTSTGADCGGAAASGQCGFTTRDNSRTCP